MVGIEQGTDRALLAAQAERDLAVLSTHGGRATPHADLTLLLRAAADAGSSASARLITSQAGSTSW